MKKPLTLSEMEDGVDDLMAGTCATLIVIATIIVICYVIQFLIGLLVAISMGG